MQIREKHISGSTAGGSRVTRWCAGATLLLVSAVVIVHLLWAQARLVSEDVSPQQVQSVAVPWIALTRVLQQLSGAELFQHFNVPLRALGLFAAWGLATIGIGHLAARKLLEGLIPVVAAEMLAIGYALGFLLVGIAFLALGVCGILQPLALTMLLAIGCGVGLREGLLCRRRGPIVQIAGRTRGFWWASALVCAIALAAFLVTWTPPVQSDAMRYHLAAVQEYVKAGRIGYLPGNTFSNFPFLVEMHYLLTVALGAPECSQMIHFSTLVGSALFVVVLSARLAGPRGNLSWAAGAFYLLLPAGLIVATWPNVDHAATLYVLASTLVLVMLLRAGDRSRVWLLLGLMCAGCLGVKYTLGPHIALVGGLALACSARRARSGTANTLRGAMTALAAVLLLGAVWFAKNYAFTGNPVYPLVNSVFRAPGWSQDNAALYARKAAEKGQPKTPKQLLLSPWYTTFEWGKYEQHNLGPFPLVAGVLLCGLVLNLVISRPRRRPGVPLVVAVAAAYWLVWFFSYQSNRMLLPFVGLVLAGMPCLMSAVAAILRKIALAAMWGASTYGGLWALQWMYLSTPLSPPPAPYLLGGSSPHEYRARSLNYWRAFEYLNGRAPQGEKVLLVGEHRVYGAKFDAIWSDWFDTPAVAVLLRESGSNSFTSFLDALGRKGVHWILINEAELSPQLTEYFRPRFSPAEWEIVEELRKGEHPRLQRRVFPPGVTVLRLLSSGSS